MHTTYLSTEDVAAKLQVVTKTVRRLVNVEGLPAHRVGRSFRFVESEVDNWIRDRDLSRVTAKQDHSHRDAIRRLVDAAPELTTAQVDRIAAILNGGK
ncbi:helix-turn-helix domain-containing protein [Prescottella equi]|uniref:helix-turn-helix domain-containing protein n=1 Tax=Rhodococcus hoagii TaxID=43767 RepID=UPI000A0FBB0B|nr:helix-turn-helix domain-containing protein [Prescottella equi]ORL76418.1 hypothetical protein A5N71_16395 [Prescottella equi]